MPMAAEVRFDDVAVGDRIPAVSKVVKREEVKAYADASGDQNPLHQDDNFARMVGFPGIIAHGMFTMAHLVSALTIWLGDPGRARVDRRPVPRGRRTWTKRSRPAGRGHRARPGDERAKLDVWVELERGGVTQYPIKNSTAEVRLG